MHILDNESSAELKERIKSNNMKYQLVPPHDHRRNIAEKAIQVSKADFISIFCGTNKSFPLHLWDRLLRQAEHTLNMLRTSKMTPSVSAYAYLWGEHDYNANPFAPLGCKVEVHVTPGTRETWAPHTQAVSTSALQRNTTNVTRSTSVTPSILEHVSPFFSNTST
jgi:hypothetical protein